MLAVTRLDGPGFTRVIAAGSYFLKRYRAVLDGLNVFPVPDGDTGSNLYATARSALWGAGRARRDGLSAVAAAAADGALRAARGNSGVIFAQMLRGFADAVRGRDAITTAQLGEAMRGGVAQARAALVDPLEGTVISVASAAADQAGARAAHTSDFYELGREIVRAANEALERTREQLPSLREAGVVDAGGAGLLYFLEGILRFVPGARDRATEYRYEANPARTFTERQTISTNKYCTEFVLTGAAIESGALKARLVSHGDSVLVAGAPPMLRVHIHTDVPYDVQRLALELGSVGGLKIDDMQAQHQSLVERRPRGALSFVAIVPGSGFERIARDLGAEVTLDANVANPSAERIAAAIEQCRADVVVVLPHETSAQLEAEVAAGRSRKRAIVVPARSIAGALGVLVAYGGRIESGPVPVRAELERAASSVCTATVAFAPDGSLEGVVGDVVADLSGNSAGLATLYYGGSQTQRDVERLTQALRERLPKVEIEWFFGGQRTSEYVVTFER